ncbi:CS1-pili formation C-terminal domain-containing protein [Photobacterium damselae subsp. damselae]|uniref:CS1-pili formation C-terminal domain-containing protein n=1 Tax=Photobacterium damselae TaxID=38293 RepID=UPI001F375B24|nr:CS1-pili formation C-terminal domain-containing protein [Photobacterium damselae]UJZ95711.1 CS1-pili formation C-terminal domain-containing protein [Photobacterium damselae subsp. damselae]
MTYKRKILAISIAALVSNSAFAIPHGFEDLYKENTGKIKFIINDDYIIELNAKYSDESVSLEPEEVKSLEDNLKETYISSDGIKKITNDLSQGVKSSLSCKGKRDICVPDFSEGISYIIIKNQKIVRVLTPPTYLNSQKNQKKYIPITNENKALISEHDLSIDMYDDSDSTYYYRNTSFLGLGPGYISGDFDLSEKSDDDDLELNELAYNFLSESTRVRFGYLSDFVNQDWNSTSLLDTNASKNFFGLTIGSTKQLEFENKETSQRIFFNSPSSGRLFVYRNDKPILQKNVNSGQNYLRLSELPQGIYDIELVVKNGERTVFKENRTIYNKSKYNLNKGEVDYSVSVGNYEKKDVYDNLNYGNNDRVEYEDRAMVNGKIAYKLNESIIVGAEAAILESDSFYKAGIDYQITNDLNLNSVINLFSNGSDYYQINAIYKNLGVQFNKYNDRHDLNEDPKIDNYFYGIGDNQELSISYNQEVLSGNAYISYINQKSEKNNYYSDYDIYNIGYSRYLFEDSNLSINYSKIDSKANYGRNDSWIISVGLDIPIGNFDSVRYSGDFDDSSQSNRIAYNHRIEPMDNVDGSIEAGIRYDSGNYVSDEFISDASLSLNTNNNQYNGSLYGYADSKGYASLSMNLNTSTVVTTDNIYTTSHSSESYLSLNNHSYIDTNNDEAFSSVANIKMNNELSKRVHINERSELVPIDNYKEYQVSIDTDASDFYNQGDDFIKTTTAPGTVIDMDLRLYNVDSYISIFNDLSGSPVSNIKCIGDGCYGVQEIQDGVYKIRVAKGQPFKLVTNNERCFIPSSDSIKSNNLGENFCMPTTENVDGIQMAKINNKYYYYVGLYNDRDVFISTAKNII